MSVRQHVFRVEFDHHDSDRPGVHHRNPDVRFIVSTHQYLVEAWAADIKWLWGEHTWEIADIGSVDLFLIAEERMS